LRKERAGKKKRGLCEQPEVKVVMQHQKARQLISHINATDWKRFDISIYCLYNIYSLWIIIRNPEEEEEDNRNIVI
jgi:hypothetical protein